MPYLLLSGLLAVMLGISLPARAEEDALAGPPALPPLSAEESPAQEAEDVPADYPEDFSSSAAIAPVAHNAFGEEEAPTPAVENSDSSQTPE